MNKLFFRGAFLAICVFSIGISSYSFAHEAFNPLHSTPIETIKSHLAYPENIHVEVTDKNVKVEGILKRRLNKKRKSLQGHVDLELLDSDNQLIERIIVPIKKIPGAARHDHQRKFTANFLLPSSAGFTVRVKHSMKSIKHAGHK